MNMKWHYSHLQYVDINAGVFSWQELNQEPNLDKLWNVFNITEHVQLNVTTTTISDMTA